MKRALIVKLGAIGDVVMAIPAAYRLMASGYSVDWVAGSAAAAVLRCYPEIRVIETDERQLLRGSARERVSALQRTWKQLSGHSYNYVVTLYYDRRYRLLSLPVRGARHVSLERGNRDLELLPGRHHTDEFARVMLSGTGEPTDSGPRTQSLSPVFPGKLPSAKLSVTDRVRITLAPGGARNLLRDDALRRWQPQAYAELAGMILAAGHEVALTGGPDDGWVREYFAGIPCVDLIGKLTLPELLAAFQESDVVVTHDSGPLHLAGLVGCGLVGVFGPVDPWGRLPRRAGAIALWGGEGFACRPCYDGSGYANCHDNQCMAQVTPAMVLTAVDDLLSQRAAGAMKSPEVRLPNATESLVHIAQRTEAAV